MIHFYPNLNHLWVFPEHLPLFILSFIYKCQIYIQPIHDELVCGQETDLSTSLFDQKEQNSDENIQEFEEITY